MIRSPAGFDGADRIKRYLDYYQPSYGVMMLSAGQFSPSQLFAQGEIGAWYDPSDMTTLFQDAAGTTPVTAVEQPVGLMLDKSKGLVLGSELVTNGTFDSDTTGWSLSGGGGSFASVSGELEITRGPATTYVFQSLTIIPGKSYKLTAVSRKSASAYSAQTRVGTSIAGSQYGIKEIFSTTNVTIEIYFTATASTLFVSLVIGGTLEGSTAYFDNISVRELPGNHASQSTSASRPVLSARVNLLTHTEEFDNAAWTRNNIAAFGSGSVANTTDTTDPLGGNTADKLVENTTTSEHSVGQNAIPASSAFVLSAYVKAAGRTICYLRSKNAAGTYTNVFFDISSGTVLTVGADWLDAAITSVGNGWYRISARRASTASPPNFASIGMTTTDDVISSVGDGTSGIYIWGADLRVTNVGVNLPAYQRVVTATNYDTVGFPMYLRFDGTDDSMATGTINPGSVDKAQVFAGVRKLSDAAQAIVVESSVTVGTNAGTFNAQAPGPSTEQFRFVSGGSNPAVGIAAVTSGHAAPVTRVMTGLADIAGDVATLRLNGAQVGQGTADQGTGNFGNYPLYIGSRGSSSLRFNGHLYSLVVRFSATNLPDATIAQTETWVNGKTYAY